MNVNNLNEPTNKKVQSFDGKLCSLDANGFDVRVRLMLLNGKKNRNNWIYENLQEHLDAFKGTPILISYKNGQLGAGHEMDEVVKPDGSVGVSFKSEAAERIVGAISENAVMRLEEIDGVEWIVTDDAIIYGWYAPELAERLKGAGNLSEQEKKRRSMRVSIETLIDDGYVKADGTEVFTKYRVLGTTVLSDTTKEAVVGANIRALAELGADKLKEMTRLRVAQAKKQITQKRNEVKNKMRIENVKGLFPNCTIVKVDGASVAMLAENKIPHVCSVEKVGEEITCVAKNEVAASVIFANGEENIEIALEDVIAMVTGEATERAENAEKKLAEVEAARTAAELALGKMQKNEAERRIKAVKEAINNRLEELKENNAALEGFECADMLTNESVEKYAKMEDEEGHFCGDISACKDVDARCMAVILEHNKNCKKNSAKKFAWEDGISGNADSKKDAVDALFDAINI